MYISLPSDASSDLFPNNTISSFKVKLPNTINLDRKKSVLGLTQIQWPNSLRNVTHIRFKIFAENPVGDKTSRVQFCIRPGFYESPQELVREINEKIRQVFIEEAPNILNGAQHCYLEFDELTEKVSFIRADDDTNLLMEFCVIMHWKMFCMLGFGLNKDSRKILRTGERAPYVVDLHAGLSQIYVYCNVIESSRILGSMYAPLLRIIPINVKHGDIANYEPRIVEYMPLRYDDISEISIELRSDTGELIEFQSGKTVVGLHIKTSAFGV